MTVLSTLVVKLVGDLGQLESDLAGAQSKVSAVGQQMTRTGGALTAGLTAPILGAAGAGIVLANNFNEGLANVASLGSEASAAVGQWAPRLQNMAIDVGKSTGDLTDGLYNVVSAFGVADDSLAVLDINARAAAGGLATTTEAINLTSAVTKGYGDTSAAAVQRVADLALTTVQLGQTTFPELAGSIGSVTPLASSLGVGMEELFGVMATATGVTGNAAAVSTQMRGVLQALMAPTADMTALMADLGFENGEAMLAQLGLQGSLEAITGAAANSGQPLQKYIGSIEGVTLAMALTGDLSDQLTEKTLAMADSAGATQAAFEAQTEGINQNGFAMQQMRIQMQVAGERIGTALMPALNNVLTAIQPLIDFVVNLAGRFGELDSTTQIIILAIVGVAAAIGPVLVAIGFLIPAIAGIGTAMAAVGGVVAAASAPILIVIGAIIGIIALLALAWANNWGDIRGKTAAAVEFIRGIIQGVGDWLNAFWTAHGATITGIITTLWDGVKAIFQSAVDFIQLIASAFRGDFEGNWEEFGRQLRQIWDNAIEAIVTTIRNLWGKIRPILVGFITSVGEMIRTTDWGAVGRSIIDGIAAGVRAAAQWLIDAVVNAARAALDAVRGFLGSNSPSTLAEQTVGVTIPQGMARGILRGVPQVERAALAAGAVVPRALAGAGVAAGGGITIQFNAPVYGWDDFDERVEAAVDAVSRRAGVRGIR